MSLPRINKAGRDKALDVASFGENWVLHGKGVYARTPFILEPWQYKDIILPLYGRLRPDGRRWYDRALIVLPRWNGKSELASLITLNHLFREPMHEGEAYIVSTTLPQAGLVFNTVKGQILRSRELSSLTTPEKKKIIIDETQCVFRCLPHNADTAQGFHPSLAVLDELHVYKDRTMVDAMLSGMIGYDEPLLVAITTVGPSQDGVWWEIYQEWLEDPHALVVFYGAKPGQDPHDPATWRAANPARWLTEEQLRSAYERVSFSAFCQLHLNLPSSRAHVRGAFDTTRWRRCRAVPRIDPKLPSVIGIDASRNWDETAVVLDQRDKDGNHNSVAWFFSGENVGEERPWVDQERVRDLVALLCHSHKVVRVAADPAYFKESLELLDADGIRVESFRQDSRHMAPASQALFDAVARGKLRHGGDKHLERHVLAAVSDETPFGWRIGKQKDRSKIDGAIALAIAVYVAEAEASPTAHRAPLVSVG